MQMRLESAAVGVEGAAVSAALVSFTFEVLPWKEVPFTESMKSDALECV